MFFRSMIRNNNILINKIKSPKFKNEDFKKYIFSILYLFKTDYLLKTDNKKLFLYSYI